MAGCDLYLRFAEAKITEACDKTAFWPLAHARGSE
jgi:hypothetical protein